MYDKITIIVHVCSEFSAWNMYESVVATGKMCLANKKDARMTMRPLGSSSLQLVC